VPSSTDRTVAPPEPAKRVLKRLDWLLPWAVVLRGDRVSCPCCGGRFRRFRRFRGRGDARCPGCGSLERHRALWLFLERSSEIHSGDLRVLHLAPEPALERRLKALPNLRYLGADLHPARGQLRADVTDLPFPDASFDMILCSHLLEHVPNDRKAMSELFRVLAPAGQAILQHPIDPRRDVSAQDPSIASRRARRRAYRQRDHVRIYGRDFGDRLQRAGFEVTFRPVEEIAGEDGTLRHRLVPDDPDVWPGGDIYVCVKPPARGRPR
jgi:SAM-dependent methyltransferase